MDAILVPELKSRRHAWIIIFVSVGTLLAYKAWKAYLREGLSLDPIHDYWPFEILSTVFRAFNSIIGVAFSFWAFSERSRITAFGNRKVFLILVGYVTAFPLVKLYFYSFGSFSSKEFLVELPFNLFTGISEEFLFRGMMFAGLWYLSSFWKAALFSSLLFTLFHLDVTNIPLDLMFLFFTGVVYCLGFRAGVSLFGLSMIHFVWDQIHFGLPWVGGESMYLYSLISLDLFFIFVISNYRYIEKR